MDMASTDAGGVAAKAGFQYQDYAAAFYVVQMLRDHSLRAVRCEVTDDIDLMFDSYDEFVQVKTTDNDRKWSLTEVCDFTKFPKPRGKPRPPPLNDSIIQKSMLTSVGAARGFRFRLLSARDVRNELVYLKTDISSRNDTTNRAELISSISSKLNNFTTLSGLDVSGWVDKCWWEVVPSLEILELRAKREISQAAFDRKYALDPDRGVSTILNAILITLTKKSALSRKIFTADQKTYKREDFIAWFDQELVAIGLNTSNFTKVYASRSATSSPALIKFIDFKPEGKRQGAGLSQGYQLGKYRYQFIAQAVVEWLPEILLRPSELADTSSASLLKNFRSMTSRLSSIESMLELTGKVLMHSTIRQDVNSDPIPASLYIGGRTAPKPQFENIHIVRKTTGDELWLGISQFCRSDKIEETINALVAKVQSLIEHDLGDHRKLILDVKEDTYLIPHNINDLLRAGNSFDDHIDRFQFVIFLGYSTETMPLEQRPGMGTDKYIEEAKNHFERIATELIRNNGFFAEIRFHVYLFPNPCLESLKKSVEDELKAAKYA
jgi:hypothetical protein